MSESLRIGTDISFHAERVKSFEQMALHADFTIIRAGQGSWIDNYFEKNRSAAKGILPRGAYWFYDNRYKPQRQADLYQAALGDDLMESYLWCDWEKQHHSQEPRFDSWVDFLNFLRHTQRAFPTKTVGIYTGYYWFNEKVPADKRYLFAEYPLWLGNYNKWDWVKAPEPWGKDGITLWQYTEGGDGEKYGLDPLVKRAIDLNRYMGDDFEEFLGEPPITGDEPADEPDAPPTIPDAPDTNGDDMDEQSKQTGRIADALERIATVYESGGSVPPSGGSGNEPPKPEYPKAWHLLTIHEVNGKGKKTAVLLRTPDTQDGNKLGVNNDTEAIVYETLPPQTIKKDGGTKIWRTELELKNVLENWAYFENQIVKNWNGKHKWLLDYPRIGKADGEFGTGAFVLRRYLRKA